MRDVALPDVPYGATAVRPDWADLPTAVRTAISARLGAPVAAATSAGGGFTRAFAAVLTTDTGQRAFVKAAPLQDPTAEWYAREYAITSALPAGVRAARPRWALAEAGYYVLCLDPIDGRVPALPWSPADLNAALDAWQSAASALAEPPSGLLAAGQAALRTLPALSQIARDDLSWWSEIAAGRKPMPPELPQVVRDHLSWWSEIAAGREPMPAFTPDWVPARLHELAALEQGLPDLVGGSGVLHGDLRIDNVLIDREGQAWLCDWTWPCLGAPWFDTVTLLVSAYAGGTDTDRLLEPWSAPPAGVDGVLAAMAGYWLVQASGPPSSASPHSRQHHRFSGTQALAWLADRRGWT